MYRASIDWAMSVAPCWNVTVAFNFTSSAPGQPVESSSITFSGKFDFRQQEFPYPETTNLEGWRVQWISKNELKAKPAEEGLTLKALRIKAKTP